MSCRPRGACSGAFVAFGGLPAASLGDFEFAAERAVFVQGADELVGIEDLDGAFGDDVARGDGAGFLLADLEDLDLIGVQIELDFLQVEDDLGDVFDHMRKRGEFVRGAVETDRGDRRALKRGEQHPAESVAKAWPRASSS